jgi:hypothetical protein
VYVSVLDNKDAPVPGLTIADFVVREDGVAREVVKVEPATGPLDVLRSSTTVKLLTPRCSRCAKGINRFIDKLQGHGTMGLMTYGERPTMVVRPTTDGRR